MITAYYTSALLAAPLLWLIRHKTVNHLLTAAMVLLNGLLCWHATWQLNKPEEGYFRSDGLALIFLWITFGLSVFSVLHYWLYAHQRGESARSVAIHNMGFSVFIAAISGVFLSTHLGLMWAFLEATTLSAAILIYHDRNRLSLEATWKYLFVSSTGIALAFTGILFLGFAARGIEGFSFDLNNLAAVSNLLDPAWLQASFLFVLAGFSVKMGVAPLFNVDIDAKDLSPSPVGALFSGALMNAGFIAIFRFYQVFSGTSIRTWMDHVLLLTGILSIFFAAVYLLKVSNIKRIFAYSSLEHGGLALVALSLGKAGCFIAVLHLAMHALVKSGLFFQTGQLHRAFGSKKYQDIGDYFRLNPYGGVVLLAGFMCISALPPSGMFITEFSLFRLLFEQHHIGAAMLIMFLLCCILYALAGNFFHVLFEHPKHQRTPTLTRPAPYESLSQVLLIGIVLITGLVQPAFLVDLIRDSIALLP